MLVGDVIVSARALFPDLPRTLPPPSGLVAVAVADATSTLAIGTYNVVFTFTNQWGETNASAIVQVPILANQSIQVQGPAFSTNPSATGCRAYFALAGQPLVQYFASPTLPITINGPGLPGTPPNRNVSFYPDSDGPTVSSYVVYDWLNDALTVAAHVCKGIPDTSGIQMVSGQGFYQMPGIWDKLENCWYDGFPVAFDARSGAFYRNKLSGIVFIGILQTSADRQILELQPQPSRAGGQTVLQASIGISDTVVPTTSTASFGLALGMFSLSDASGNLEICSYGSIVGASLTGVARGLGGTAQRAWPANTTIIQELNFRFSGLRLNAQVQYKPGNALSVLQVPPGWKPALIDYLVGKFRSWERADGSSEYLKNFTAFLKDYLQGTKQVAGPRQIGSSTPAGDGYPSASSGGRIIVP